MVRLKLNYDAIKALSEISSKVDQVRRDLPPEAEVPTINVESADSRFASAYLSFTAESLGINTTLYKTIALCISGVLTGIAGAFYTSYMGYIDPHVAFALHDISIITIMIVMVGGVATFWGPFVGALIMVLLAEFIRSMPGLGTAHQTFFGILLIVIIIFLPNGIVGDYRKLKRIVGLGRASS